VTDETLNFFLFTFSAFLQLTEFVKFVKLMRPSSDHLSQNKDSFSKFKGKYKRKVKLIIKKKTWRI